MDIVFISGAAAFACACLYLLWFAYKEVRSIAREEARRGEALEKDLEKKADAQAPAPTPVRSGHVVVLHEDLYARLQELADQRGYAGGPMAVLSHAIGVEELVATKAAEGLRLAFVDAQRKVVYYVRCQQ